MDLRVLLATVLWLSPAVHGCVVFQAAWGGPCDANELYSVVIDDGWEVCTMKGRPGSDSTYYYTCYKAHYWAVFDAHSGVLHYGTDHGNWSLPTSNIGPGHWTTCQFGCSDQQCWVKTTNEGSCASPSPFHKGPTPGAYVHTAPAASPGYHKAPAPTPSHKAPAPSPSPRHL
ncbi:unnamed protein product [Calypogeia fissa]